MSAHTIPSPIETRTPAPAESLRALLPGVALLFGIGILGKVLERAPSLIHPRDPHIFFPHIEYVLWAILLGLAVSNTIGVSPRFRPGVATYALRRKRGIVLVGGKFLLQDVLHIGGLSLALVAVELVLSLSVMTLL